MGSAVLAFGIFTFVTTVLLVYRYGSPVVYWDQWPLVFDLMRSGGHPTFAQIWAPNNEHLMPLGKLPGYADLLYFGGKNTSLLIENFALQVFSLAALVWMVRRYGRLGLAAFLTVAGFLCFCLFTPIQIETFYWGFEVTSFINILASIVAMAACIVHSERLSGIGEQPLFSGALLVAVLACVCAELTMASGTFLWLVLLAIGYVLRFPKKTQWLMAAVSACAIGVFLLGFRSPGHHAKPMESLRHPVLIFEYVRTYFAFSWDSRVPTPWAWPAFAELFTCVAVVSVAVGACRLAMRRPKGSQLETFLLANMVFGLMTAGATALGRMNFGIAQATSGRYQTNALIFWACFGAWVVVLRMRDLRNVARLVEIQAVLLLVLIATGTRTDAAEKIAVDRQVKAGQAYAALVQNRPAEAGYISPFPELQQGFVYMREHRMGPDPRGYGAGAGTIAQIGPAEMGALRLRGFDVVAKGGCAGFVDNVSPVGGRGDVMALRGWAWSAAATKAPREVVFGLADGRVAGSAEIDLARPDVQRALPVVKEAKTGWTAQVAVPEHDSLRVFVKLDGGRSVCPLDVQYKEP